MSNINKPTLKKPTDLGKKYEKTTKQINPLLEVDELLTEKEVSLKKKIFSLAKMESLVHADPMLSAIYDDMAINGEEKYGYHYNETIMNMIFNDYVLNDSSYLQKYKQAIPKKKKRRDKSGINQLKAKGEKEMEKKGLKPKETEKKEIKENENILVDVIFYLEDEGDVIAYFPHENHDSSGKLKMCYSHVGQHSACQPNYVKNLQKATPEQYESLKNELENLVGYDLNILSDINETSTTGSVGGAGMGSGGYVTPHAWGDGDLMKGKKSKALRKPIWNGGQLVNENYGNVIDDPNEVERLLKNKLLKKSDVPKVVGEALYKFAEIIANKLLSNYGFDWDTLPDINSLWDYIDENGGMTYQNLVSSVKDAVEDRLSEDGFMDLFNENYLIDTKIFENYVKELEKENTIDMKENRKHDNFKRYARDIEKGIIDPEEFDDELSISNYMKQNKDRFDDEHEDEFEDEHEFAIDEHHLTLLSDKITYIKNAYNKMATMGKPDIALTVLNYLSKENVDMLYHDTENMLRRMDIDPKSIDHKSELRGVAESDLDEVSMIDDNPESMSNKVTGASMEMGMNSGGGISEENILDSIDEELKAFEIHQNSLKNIFEDRKTSSMINKDRMGVENQKNFKRDLKYSGTKEVIDIEKELQWKDQQEEVGKNPKKYSEALEKDMLKRTKGEALKNVGDSTNEKGNEIPKRNHTDEEQEEIDLYREGMHSLDYDTTNDRFEDRVKDEMGDTLYKRGREQVENRKNRPMYNKDEQPITDDKLNESIISGFYFDDLNKRKIIGFKPRNVRMVENVNKLHLIDFGGVGNSRGYMGEINESIDNYITKYNFYTDGKNVFLKNKSLNESKTTKKESIALDKITHLMNYKPNSFVDTKNVKKNRGF